MAKEEKDGMSKETKIRSIEESIRDISPDILDLIYKIILFSESGLE